MTRRIRVLRKYDCADCGTPTVRLRQDFQPLVCEQCSIDRAVAAARQMAARAGPAYDRWKASPGPTGRHRNRSRE